MAVELARNPQLRGRPVVVTEATGQARRVLDASPRAVGVRAGMPLAHALSVCKDAVLMEADAAAYRAAFDDVLNGLEGLALDVEEEGLGLAYVRLDNAAQLHGGLDGVIDAVLLTLPQWLPARMGVGDGKFVAYAVATTARYGQVRRADRDGASMLGRLSVDLLPVDHRTIQRLHDFGLRTLGQIASLGAGPLQAQFGPTGKLMWDLARGIDPRPFVPRRHEEAVEESLTFPMPVGTLDAIGAAVDTLLARAFSRPAMRGRYARECTIGGAVFRGPPWHKRMVFLQPLGDRHQARSLIEHTLKGHPPPSPLEDLRLTLSGLTGEAGRQASLFADVRRRENLSEAVRQLAARLRREPPLYHVREVEPWSLIPERRHVLMPFH